MLREKLEEISKGFAEKVDEKKRAKIEGFLEDLIATGIEENVIRAGETLPEFTFLSKKNGAINKERFKGKKLILNFFRGSWCPYCNLELGALADYNEKFQKEGGALISITPELEKYHDGELESESALLIGTDIDSEYGRKLGIVFKLTKEVDKIYKELGIDISDYNENNTLELPIPATIITDTDGVVRYVYASADYTKRAEPEEILKVLKELD